MNNCKEIQGMIEDFEYNRLSLKNEEKFTGHILNCADCREEMEIYYIISYGLDDMEKNMSDSRYASYIDSFDFTGLVDQKLEDSGIKCQFIREWSYFNRLRYMFVTGVMLLTTFLLVVIRFF